MSEGKEQRMPYVKIASLQKKVGQKGEYFIGRLGQTKVWLFKDDKASKPDTWNLLVQEQSEQERQEFEEWKAKSAR